MPIAGLESFDHLGRDLVRKANMPGVSIAVGYNGRLVFARGFGYADIENREPVTPDSLFRIASLSKPITAVMIAKLAAQRRLSLRRRAFEILPEYIKPAPFDDRIRRITINQLLHHTAGWDRGAEGSFDPMFRSLEIASALGMASPPSASAMIRYMMRFPLQFDPGSLYAYSNFGYCILGRIIEKITGRPYEAAVKQELLSPLGIEKMQIGHSRLEDRAPDEVVYYHPNPRIRTPGVYPGLGMVPWQYGGWCLEAMDSHGGWIATAADLVRFADAIDALSIRALVAKPPSIPHFTDRTWYGKGFVVRKAGRGYDLWHDGALDGTLSFLLRAANGFTCALLANSRPQNRHAPAAVDAGVRNALATCVPVP